MGEVYRARDERLARDVAIKVLPAPFAADADRLRRFSQEARAAGALNHPNVLVVHDVGAHEGAPFLVTELLAGETLRERLRAGDLPPRKAVELTAQIAAGLAAAHERGIVHRDLKPENLFLTSDGVAKILDFGLAKSAVGDRAASPGEDDGKTSDLADRSTIPAKAGLTLPGSLMGTPAYLAPEQARGLPADHRADIFALGCVLHELIAGRPPFSRATLAGTLGAILTEDPPPLPERAVDALPGIDRVIAHCVEKRPEDRFQATRDLEFDLRAILTGTEPRAPAAGGPDSASRRSRRRSTRLLSMGLVLGVLAVLAFGWLQRDRAPWRIAGVKSQRILVTILENETGDPALDPVGRMASDWITQGLLRIEGLDVVPSTTLLFTRPAGERAAGAGSESWRQLVKETGAGTVISGAYYRQGETLQFQVKVTDAAGGTLFLALDPVIGSAAEPMPAIDELRQRLMGAMATQQEAEHYLGPRQEPPLYDAYREFIAGFELFMTDDAEALRHFQRACEIDSTFYAPLLFEAYLYNELGDHSGSETTLRRLALKREQLAPLTLGWLDALAAYGAHRYPEALRILRNAQTLAPRDPLLNHWIGYLALSSNLPRLTVETYAQFDAHPWSRHSGHPLGASWVMLHCRALHMLGDHQRELVESRRGRESFPDRLDLVVLEVTALAALGRLAEVSEIVARSEASAFTGATPGDVMLRAAMELRAHGHREESLAYARRAAAWFRERSADPSARQDLREEYLDALRWAEEWDDLADLCRARLRESPEDVAALGTLGAIAALRGDPQEALRYSAALGELKGPYLFGTHVFQRACIAALLGDEPAAIELLRRSFAEGVAYDLGLHRQIDLEPLWDAPAFTELLRPGADR